MSLHEFLDWSPDDEAVEIFEAGMAYLDSWQNDTAGRAAMHQDTRFWSWWARYWKNTGDAFVRASQHLSATASRRDAWQDWKASMSVGLPPRSVLRQAKKRHANQG
jgi:hypothetical protein